MGSSSEISHDPSAESFYETKEQDEMKRTSITKLISGLVLVCLFFVANLSAQEVLPKPEQPFKGKIGRTASDEKRLEELNWRFAGVRD